MRVGAARCFKAGVRFGQTFRHFWAVSGPKSLVRAPAPGNKALRSQHVKPVLCCAQVLFASESEIGLHRGAKRIYMAVRMSGRKRIFSGRERPKKRIVKIADSSFLVSLTRSTLVCDELIFRNRIGLIPGIRFVCTRTPTLSLFNSVSRQMRQRRISCAL